MGIEPITILAISWESTIDSAGKINYYGSISKYADKDIVDSEGNTIINGCITEMGELDETVRIDSGSTTASLSVTLFDVDGSIKELFDKFDLHKRPVIVYQHFAGLDPTVHPWQTVNTPDDPFEVFRGEVATPITWSEGDRTLSFDIISKVYALEAGFAPEQGQFSYVPVDLIGQPWPICFGTPIHTPATKARHVLNGTVMSTFGLPDYTLQYKLNLLEHVQTDLIGSFNHYRNLINLAYDIEVPSYQLQEDFANHIVSHDAMKQTVEDLHESIEEINRQVVTLIAQYDSDQDGEDTRAEILAQIQPLKNQREPLNKQYRQCVVQLQNMENEADAYKLRLKNAKFEVTIINKLRKKCRAVLGDYYICTKQIEAIQSAMQNQNTLNTNSSAVMTGPEFPQNTTTLFDINGLRLAGVMQNYSLGGITQQPNYTNLIVDPRPDSPEGDDVTALWLNKTQLQQLANGGTQYNSGDMGMSINLVGQYLWLQGQDSDQTTVPPTLDPIDKRIVQVVTQSGNKITCQLMNKQRNPRIQKQTVDYVNDPKIKESFQNTLERMLTGNESDEQIQNIANQIPKDLSPKIWKILDGGSNIIYIELHNTTTYDPRIVTSQPPPRMDYDNSAFTLTYNNEEVTDPITFKDTASIIEHKIINSTASIDNNDITVTIEKYWSGQNIPDNTVWRLLKIEYNNLMRPLRFEDINIINRAGQNKDFGQVSLRKVSTEPIKCVIAFNPDCLRDRSNTVVLFDKATIFNDNGQIANNVSPVIKMYFRGYCINWNVNNHTASDIQQLIWDLDPSFVNTVTVESIDVNNNPVANTTLKNNNMVINFNTEFTSVFLDTSRILYTVKKPNPDSTFSYSTINKKDLISPAYPPKISIQGSGSGGAHEYTYNERMTMLQNMVQKNLNSPGIQNYRNKIRKLLKEMKDQVEAGGAADQGAREAIQHAMTTYRSMIKSAGQSGFVNDTAYKLISDEEYTLLYDMEVTGYLEWLNSFVDIDEEFTDNIDYEFTMVDVVGIREVASHIPKHWLKRLDYDPTDTDVNRIQSGQLTINEILYETYLLPNNTNAWIANVGDTINLEGNYQETYVCSLIPGTIKAVYAQKSVGGINRLIPVPSSYYYKIDATTPTHVGLDYNQYIGCTQQANTLGYADFGLYHGVSVTLMKPLSQIDPTWSDQLYVTVQSLVGPNVCDVLCWLIYTYTDLKVDLTSFQHVWALQQNYPVNFCLTQKTNVIQLIEDIAYQARCILWIQHDTVFIRYMPESPTPYKTITPADIEAASLKLSYTNTEQLITKYVATWRQTYAQTQEYTMTMRRNLSRYNEIMDSHEFFIYNTRDLVWKSATWWMLMKGSTFKLAKFRLFINNLDLQTQDCINIDMGNMFDKNGNIVPNTMISSGPTKAIITKATYNSSDFSVDVECWLPILAGKQTEWQFAFPKNFSTVNSWPTLTDIAGGDAGSPRNMQVPSGLTYNLGGGGLDYPIDMGRPNVGDHFDSLPPDPSDPFQELDYIELSNVPITINANLNSDLNNDGETHEVLEAPKESAEAPREWAKEAQSYDGHILYADWLKRDAITEEFTWHPVGAKTTTYMVKIDGNPYLDQAEGIGIPLTTRLDNDDDDTNELEEGTPIRITKENGKWVFRLITPLQPEQTTDPTGQPLDGNNDGGGFY